MRQCGQMSRFTIAVLASSALAACCPQAGCPSLDQLGQADPASDARAASSRGDDSLLMLGGYVGTIPGYEGKQSPLTRLMEGTSDQETDVCRRLRPLAEIYARKYNATIVAMKEPAN
jgi:hypothetical protein